ncbi:intradiol ring-cleavage dioxygenase-like protein (extracellular dioxygenase) [Colletotrichum truncatum]|uniref:Intradiol ring-cleavage dioxygenase-like protein (Extracellular dioxygenase) n=1 Tax=Colletotrichum truncatum TaxID=5467 RepID=A0ACC3ZHH9_COLTU|nr:intradiol ring-cleavage dioxygenase-like protein (extracellular dioxygenase) [Colletotrichum truncatum]KAF6781016.1 intradiol ring-cleavage dioxygenase-like protein (extracellular dioxygenase) [Colletotrichum truncatum]
MALKLILLQLLLVPLGLAHPHGVEEREFQHAAQPWYRRSLDHCAEAFSEPEFVKRTIERRHEELQRLRQKRGIEDIPIIHGRDFNTVLRTDHRVNKPYNENTPASELFAGSGACMLTPEQTEGPLYVKGEEVRRELTEGEGGVKMTIDIQVVDVKTCKPITNAAVDFWSANSTGVYGGVLNYPGNGNPNDLSLINTTTLRGIQFTDVEGMATFDTVVPGHYAGRTNHVHAIAHLGAIKQPNNTITGGKVAHIGQMYFDQKLLDEVERLPPYSTNHQAVTKNAQDALLAMSSNNDDPVVRYVLVGKTLADGIYAWIRFGVDSNANRPLNPAAWIDEKGGHQGNPNPGGSPFPGWPWGKNKRENEEDS